jgi:hypothetical protein
VILAQDWAKNSATESRPPEEVVANVQRLAEDFEILADRCENAPNLDPAQWNDHQPEPAILS